ncbi:His/Gly/Thr/Pro-type tRNA ligase C-terminal domain-containing protein, partial [Enterococcus faecium]|uniref:His/Gly/Thr/Pro-type tRNA ligase C-terminal domain-containing protein n=1 Tax=Enterococcus faecium TaxID=1352 RepID=UPI00292EE430
FSADRDFMNRKAKAQFKTADKANAKLVLVIGEDELASQTINVKEMNQAEFIHLILSHLENYKPKSIKRVMIPKPNGEKRPLGIP